MGSNFNSGGSLKLTLAIEKLSIPVRNVLDS